MCQVANFRNYIAFHCSINFQLFSTHYSYKSDCLKIDFKFLIGFSLSFFSTYISNLSTFYIYWIIPFTKFVLYFHCSKVKEHNATIIGIPVCFLYLVSKCPHLHSCWMNLKSFSSSCPWAPGPKELCKQGHRICLWEKKIAGGCTSQMQFSPPKKPCAFFVFTYQP